MKKIIIIMGHLAAYKTTVAKRLAEDLGLLSFYKDEIKERITEDIGYQSREENIKLSSAAFSILKLNAEAATKSGIPILLESNFKYLELSKLKPMIDERKVDVLTFFFTGDSKVLYTRYTKRQPSRHIAHTSTGLMSYEVFKSSMFEYDLSQSLGESYEIDTTKFNDKDYNEIKEIILSFILK